MSLGPLLLSKSEWVMVEVVSVDRLQRVPAVVEEELGRRHDAQRLSFRRHRQNVRRQFVILDRMD